MMASTSLCSRATAALLVAVLVTTAHGDDRLAEAKQALRDWRNAFVNVRIRFTIEFLNIAPEEDFETATSRVEWTWTEDLYCFEDRVMVYDGIAKTRETAGVDANQWYFSMVEISPEGEEFLEFLTLGDSRGRSTVGRTGMVVTPLMELWQVQPRCAWLPDVIDELDFTYEGPVEIDGMECVEYSYFQGEGAETMRHRVVLDPSHDYLPRRVVLEQVRDPSNNPWNHVVTEFLQTEAGTWFPARGTFECVDGANRWTVDEVVLNSAFDAEYFSPPAPMNGTKVLEGSRPVYVAGNGEVPDFVAEERSKERVTHPETQQVVAVPAAASGWIWSILLAVAGMVSFFAAWKLKQA
jgi:hypothetical protein